MKAKLKSGKLKVEIISAFYFLLSAFAFGQGSKTPINNGILQSDLNAAGYKITNANLVDYAGTGLSWNVVTGKFDATGGGGAGSPGGSNTQFQYNNAGAFDGIPAMTYDGTIPATITMTPAAGVRATGIKLQNTATYTGTNRAAPAIHFIQQANGGLMGHGTFDTTIVAEGGYLKFVTSAPPDGTLGPPTAVGFDSHGNFTQIDGDAGCTFAGFNALNYVQLGHVENATALFTDNGNGYLQLAGNPWHGCNRISWNNSTTTLGNPPLDTAFGRSEAGGVGVYTGPTVSTLGLLRVATQAPGDNTTKAATTAFVTAAVAAGGGGGAPTTATYITQTADAGLSAEVALSTLATGLLKSTTTTGALTTVTAPAGAVVGTTDTQTFSAKTIGDKLDITSVSTPATPSSGTARLYAGSVLGVDALGYLNSLGVPIVLGRDVIFLAKNVTGATILKGCPVYIVSAASATPNIAKAQSEATMSKLPAAGFTAHDIANNTTGMVMIKGVLSNVNTSAQADGASLYVGTTAGTFTSIRPTHPNPTQEIGVVEDSNVSTGTILVNCGPSLVARQDGVNGSSWAIGDGTGTTKSFLFKNAAGTGTLSWNPSTNRTLTLPDFTGTLYGSGGTDVAIADGGTGVSTLPAGLLVGAGTSAITAVTAPSGAVVGISDTQTLTNKRITPRVTTITSNATLSPSADNDDLYAVSALATAVTAVNAPSGTPVDGQKLIIRIISDSSVRAISGWNAIYRFSATFPAPSTTVASTTHTWGFMYNATAVKWDCLAQAANP